MEKDIVLYCSNIFPKAQQCLKLFTCTNVNIFIAQDKDIAQCTLFLQVRQENVYIEGFGRTLLILSTDNQFAQAYDESQECVKPNLCIFINVCAF